MGTNKTYNKYSKMISEKALGTPWTENEIIYFRKYLRDSNSLQLNHDFYINMPETGYSIMGSQSVKGTNYLLNNSLKMNGEPRKNSILGSTEIDILKNIDRHTFVGLYSVSNYTSYTLPVYRAISKTGQYFEYTGTTYSQIEVLSVYRGLSLVS